MHTVLNILAQVDPDKKKNVKRRRKTFEVTKRQGKQARNHDLRKSVFLFWKHAYRIRAYSGSKV